MWIGNTSELKLVFVFLAVGYLGYFVLFLERKCQEENCEGGGESSDHQDTIEGARAVCPGDEKAQRIWGTDSKCLEDVLVLIGTTIRSLFLCYQKAELEPGGRHFREADFP